MVINRGSWRRVIAAFVVGVTVSVVVPYLTPTSAKRVDNSEQTCLYAGHTIKLGDVVRVDEANYIRCVPDAMWARFESVEVLSADDLIASAKPVTLRKGLETQAALNLLIERGAATCHTVRRVLWFH